MTTGKPTIYQIRIKEHLAAFWAEWFDPLVIRYEADGETTLTGPLRDQAELFGILTKVNNLNLTLVALKQIEKGRTRSAHHPCSGISEDAPSRDFWYNSSS